MSDEEWQESDDEWEELDVRDAIAQLQAGETNLEW